MKKYVLVLLFVAAGVIAVASITTQFTAQAGCCSNMGPMSGHDMNPAHPSVVAEKLSQPVATIFDNYSRIQTALTQDSLKDVTTEARAIAQAVNDDTTSSFPRTVAQQAEVVAKAADLRSARKAFKPLSQSLIAYVSQHPSLAGTYRQVHCPMANADWLQKESTVNNPYMGKEMLRCGEFVTNSDTPK